MNAKKEARESYYAVLGWMNSQGAEADRSEVRALRAEAAILLGERMGFMRHRRAIKAHESDARSVAFTPDGMKLVTGSFDHTAKVWDARSLRLLATLRGHESPICCAAVSPDGQMLATAGREDKAVRLWDLTTYRMLGTLTGHTKRVLRVAFSPDGRTVASCSRDKDIRIWDVGSLSLRRRLQGHAESVECLVFTPDGKRLISGGWDGIIRQWDMESGEELPAIGSGWRAALGIALSPDGSTLAVGLGQDGENLILWDLTAGKRLTTLAGHVCWVLSVAFSPDGRMLASCGEDGVRLWDVEGKCALALGRRHWGNVWNVAFSPDSRTLVSVGVDGTVRLWEVGPSGRPAEAYRELGRAKAELGRYAETEAGLRRGLSVVPNSVGIRVDLSFLLAGCPDPNVRDDTAAAALAAEAVKRAPEDAACQLAVGYARYCAGDYQAALVVAQKAGELDQECSAALFLQAMAHWRTG